MEWVLIICAWLAWLYVNAWRDDVKRLTSNQSNFCAELATLRQAAEAKRNEYTQTFCAIDCETTGLDRARSRVIQLALVLFKNGKRAGSKSWLINPGVRIPPSATRVHKITNEMLKDQPSFDDLLQEISKLVHRYPLVGHNLRFDYEILEAEFRKHNKMFEPKVLYCTMRCTKDLFRIEDDHSRRAGPRWLKLEALAKELVIAPSGPLHDAIVDADLAGRIFIEQRKQEADTLKERSEWIEEQIMEISCRLHRLQKNDWRRFLFQAGFRPKM